MAKAKPTMSFVHYAETVVIPDAEARILEGENAPTLARDYRQRLNCYCRPFFGTMALHRIDAPKVREFRNYLATDRGLGQTSILPILSFVSKTLSMAAEDGYVDQAPKIRRPSQRAKPRAWFDQVQYRQLLKGLKQIEAGNPTIKWKGYVVDWQLRALVTFLVNSFLRPGDLFVLKHSHVTIVDEVPATATAEGEHGYLRLNLPPSKDHHAPVITMPTAVHIYRRILSKQPKEQTGPDDYVFFPDRASRTFAKEIVRRQFNLVLKHLDLKTDELGRDRCLYSLRHSGIMFRLMNADGLDLLTLARASRTSVEVIDRHYAQPMTAEMNRDKLFSNRRPNRWLAINRAQAGEAA